MSEENVLKGEERVVHWARLGRKVRQGALQALDVSDTDRFLDALRRKDRESALGYLEIFRTVHIGMSSILLEWAIAYYESLEALYGAEKARGLVQVAYDAWRDVLDSEKKAPEQLEAARALLEILSVARCQTNRDRKLAAAELNAAPLATLSGMEEKVRGGRFEDAAADFAVMMSQSQGRHDFLCQYLWVMPTILDREMGQKASEDIMLHAFQTVSAYKPFYDFVRTCTPEDLVLFLAEHMRGHFGGPGRRGAVQIIEEKDRYRLIFDACGSGGAMRRKAAIHPHAALGTYRTATPSTWYRENDVPTYCAHCAQNEIEMHRNMGYMGWVVEFDPDHRKACEWDVYKDPSLVPDRYFERLGLKKDSKSHQRSKGGAKAE